MEKNSFSVEILAGQVVAPSTWSHLRHLLTSPHLFSWPPRLHWGHRHQSWTWRSPALLTGFLPLQLVFWHHVSVFAAPAVHIQVQVIVRGVDRRTGAASAWRTSVKLWWAHADPLSPADSSRFSRPGQCICHNVSTPCSSLLWPSQGWNHSSFYSSPGLEAIHHEARDLHQLFCWEKGWGKGGFWKANTSWFNWKASMLKAAEEISPKMEVGR